MRLASYHGRHGHYVPRLQCVTFAREESGIELSGNAGNWWENAAGVYARGERPEVGAVLSFKANSRMRLGHVAVVTTVVDSREVQIDQANWSGPGAHRGGISRDIPVVDVSPGNDWSAVRVGLGHSGDYGSIYPTYGFIYDRADHGTILAARPSEAPVPALNPPPADLRVASHLHPGAEAVSEAWAAKRRYDEVAEAPANASGIGTTSPNAAAASGR
ncbi:MAG TPA: CHAP domain-containing protein [Acetobacteraceae bacterium]|nr:CHAP domain-containing protein [Acetobacteraceae bacterium]